MQTQGSDKNDAEFTGRPATVRPLSSISLKFELEADGCVQCNQPLSISSVSRRILQVEINSEDSQP